MEYRLGKDTDEAMVGALIEAQQAADLRDLGALARGLGSKHGS